MTQVSCIVEVINLRGLHARAAARFVKLAESFDAQIQVRHGTRQVVGTSLMGLLLLGAGKGTTLELICEGPSAQPACDALQSLISRYFDEEG